MTCCVSPVGVHLCTAGVFALLCGLHELHESMVLACSHPPRSSAHAGTQLNHGVLVVGYGFDRNDPAPAGGDDDDAPNASSGSGAFAGGDAIGDALYSAYSSYGEPYREDGGRASTHGGRAERLDWSRDDGAGAGEDDDDGDADDGRPTRGTPYWLVKNSWWVRRLGVRGDGGRAGMRGGGGGAAE